MIEKLQSSGAQKIINAHAAAALWGVLSGGVTERLPHVHYRQTELFGRLFPEKAIKLIHARFAPVFAAEPDGSVLLQVADHDAIVVPLAHRDLVDADHLGPGLAGALQLLTHVLHLEPLDRVPVQPLLLGYVLDGAGAAALPDIAGKALAVQRVLKEILQPLALHGATAPALNPAHLQIHVNAVVPTGQIPCPAAPAVVPANVHCAAGPADRFFPRRTRVMSRACGSPNIPCTVSRVRNPGNRYASASRRVLRALGIAQSCQNPAPHRQTSYAVKTGLSALLDARFDPHEITKSLNKRGPQMSSNLPAAGALPPAHRAARPKLDQKLSPATLLVFIGLLALGLWFTGHGLVRDVGDTGVRVTTWLPFILLGIALLIALGFEFVNGFHDTANAVATVIYTHALPPNFAVVWSGCFNFLGVLVSSGAVAFGIISLLPVELILQVGSSAGFAMVFALLVAAIIWNLGTWWLGLPASSSQTLIGSIIGVGVANALMHGRDGTSGVDWGQATKVGY